MLAARLLRRGGPAALYPRVAYLRTYTATSGYGDPEQTGFGSSGIGQTQSTADLEHPGPPPPPASEGNVEAQNGSGKPRPRINPHSTPGGQGDKDVERHNREMAERYDKRRGGGEDGGGYWKGRENKGP